MKERKGKHAKEKKVIGKERKENQKNTIEGKRK